MNKAIENTLRCRLHSNSWVACAAVCTVGISLLRQLSSSVFFSLFSLLLSFFYVVFLSLPLILFTVLLFLYPLFILFAVLLLLYPPSFFLSFFLLIHPLFCSLCYLIYLFNYFSTLPSPLLFFSFTLSALLFFPFFQVTSPFGC